MPELVIEGKKNRIDCIVFDKDGTLLDFNSLWGLKIDRWIQALILAAEEEGSIEIPALRSALDRTLGYDPERGRVIPDSPLAVAAMPRLYGVAMTVLYQNGIPWHRAEMIAERQWQSSVAMIDAEQVRPVGDVAGTMRTLKEAGFLLAIITSDDRSSTAATLPILGIEQWVDTFVCGDDPIPVKPAPEGLWHIGRELNVTPEKMMIVGDTASDMLAGRNAGVAFCIGISDGGGDPLLLAQQADAILPSIDQLLTWFPK